MAYNENFMDKKTFLGLLGPFPAKCGLNPSTIERVDCGNFIREKVLYNVEPDEQISAFVLIPKTIKTGAPAVVCYHQHASDYSMGKSEVVGLKGDPDMAYGKELAERGYIVFAPDAIAFEERNWHPQKESWWGIEYFELVTRLLQGKTLLAKVLHDISVGINYLESRPEVDRENIGFLGHSYGGRMALLVPALDERIKASVSNCYALNYKNSVKKDSGTRISMELVVPNIMQHGDVEDIIKMIEPRSLYISAAKNDKWSRDAQSLFNAAKTSFKKGELKLNIWPGDHAFTRKMREQAYTFLDKHLCAQ